ncbi:uncharacterized protein SPPG_07290 [Spizellomyces punctatus DAOM BR117]|uniref:Fibronectin type-III domain-containing protein n=1 Tax=Spizellomyces punctatus (strain DAOM BR117) TaxID=645134 RepID=A0A0L0H9N5_SPIPD|nr:uncharacterized protein SPPG_07290 [Spizellomyces punctatus DAOM BR117]KNC97363.1 hypothetical protein SPPG_07290 [Spizellomyces punctatus DAOM BR117]|eukprot:XP_016605403.1 hypothetical protein SPPG_07290 [Spizellomyces punctatus DAOM BR117]
MPTSVIPTPKIISAAARSLVVEWETQDEVEQTGTYQLSRGEEADPELLVVYEGSDTNVEIHDLKPETRYRIKLRVRESPELGGDWSKEYAEIEGRTTDETLSARLTNQLFRAVGNNDAEAIRRITSDHGKEVSLEMRDRFGKTMLMNACQSASRGVVEALLKAGASDTATTRSGKTPLSLAATYGNLRAVEALLDRSTETLDSQDLGGSTPLMWAAENATSKHPHGVAIVELLLDKGASVNIEDARQQTALDRLCATSGSISAARAMLEKGARIITEVDKHNNVHMTTLMSAALNGHRDLCVELMDRWGVDPRARTEFGNCY